MIEALSDGGVRMGLPRDVAQLLAKTQQPNRIALSDYVTNGRPSA